ncbi:NAD(P)H-hydrate epimerase [Herbiconiux sp. L3-i23]|uniref:NAD(P)H-hydrate epimerase n=1 Tax=Herbiconiux sp. L3-i23 TaxID=2905871 RepID=UPI00205F23CF|nr:NAD(P)H-hydrate epimerase [Herbiconiux sp. L3-i23]BDI22616.1 hypothetical protein L3i23_13920 [Herbiconiux sp. L3-i23]
MTEVAGYTAAQVRAAEAPSLAAGLPLMRRAATALAAVVRERLVERADMRQAGDRARVLALVGPGNNGGDALFAVAELGAEGVEVVVIPVVPEKVHAEGLAAALSAGATTVAAGSTALEVLLPTADVVIDGLFGTGSAGRPDLALRGPAREVVGQLLAVAAPERPTVVAVDIPSGIDADTGAVPDDCVLPADVTVTFGGVKAGLLLPPASALAGEIRLVDIGIGDELARHTPVLRAELPSR